MPKKQKKSLKKKVQKKEQDKYKVVYYDEKGKITTYISSKKFTRMDIFIGKKRVFSKRGYFEHDLKPDFTKPLPEVFIKPFAPIGEVSFTLKTKDRLWDTIPEIALQTALRKAKTDRIRIFIESKYKDDILKWQHELLAPTKQLAVKGSKSYQKKLRSEARRRIKQAIMDSIITDISKSGYRASGKAKIDKSSLNDDMKKLRKKLPLLKSISVKVLYE